VTRRAWSSWSWHRLARIGAPARPWLGLGLAARRAGGFVNVAREGGVHAIVLVPWRPRRCGAAVSTPVDRYGCWAWPRCGVSGAPRGLRIPPRHLARAGMLARYRESQRSRRAHSYVPAINSAPSAALYDHGFLDHERGTGPVTSDRGLARPARRRSHPWLLGTEGPAAWARCMDLDETVIRP
jgi:hypothetical protein